MKRIKPQQRIDFHGVAWLFVSGIVECWIKPLKTQKSGVEMLRKLTIAVSFVTGTACAPSIVGSWEMEEDTECDTTVVTLDASYEDYMGETYTQTMCPDDGRFEFDLNEGFDGDSMMKVEMTETASNCSWDANCSDSRVWDIDVEGDAEAKETSAGWDINIEMDGVLAINYEGDIESSALTMDVEMECFFLDGSILECEVEMNGEDADDLVFYRR
jgi:hypothetical protein